MKRALKSYRRNKYNSSIKLINRIDCLFMYIEKNYTKIFYVPLAVLLILIVMKTNGFIKLNWEQVLLFSLLLYFPLVVIPILYTKYFGRKIALIIIGFLLIYIVDILIKLNSELIGLSALIFCFSVGGFFAIRNIFGIAYNFFQYIKNIIK
jgi:hypothetical protein